MIIWIGLDSVCICTNLVIDNILQRDAKLVIEVVEEFLVEDEGNTGYLLDMTLKYFSISCRHSKANSPLPQSACL
jgi:hypothetical protein